MSNKKKKMEIECPLCGSDDTERLALTYAGGTSHTTTHTVFGMGGGGLLAAFVGSLAVGEFPGWLVLMLLATMAYSALPADAQHTATAGLFSILPFWFVLRVLRSFGYGISFSKTQTLLAKEAGPPRRMSPVVMALFGFAAGMSLFFLAGVLFPGAEGIWVLPALALCLLVPMALGVVAAKTYNEKIWSPAEAAWQRTFQCKRCGGTFIEADYDPIGINAVRSDKMGKGGGFPKAFDERSFDKARKKAAWDAETVRKTDAGFKKRGG